MCLGASFKLGRHQELDRFRHPQRSGCEHSSENKLQLLEIYPLPDSTGQSMVMGWRGEEEASYYYYFIILFFF